MLGRTRRGRLTSSRPDTAVLCLSAGLDSAVNLAAACRRRGGVRLALTFDYGQRAARREAACARRLAGRYGVPWRLIRLPWLGEITGTALVARGRKLPELSPKQLDDRARTLKSAAAVWVPHRNGVFLNVAAAFAEALGCREVLIGFNREEAATFPDNSAAFGRATTAAFRFSTATRVRVRSYTARLDKRGIVRLAGHLGLPLDLVWPCYEGGRSPCGCCESCLRFRRACASARIPSPWPLQHPSPASFSSSTTTGPSAFSSPRS